MDKPVNALFISFDGLTDPLGQSQVIPYITGLAKNGYHITILSCEKRARYNKSSAKIKSTLVEHGIQWSPVNYTKNVPVFAPLFNLAKMYFAAKKILRRQPIQLFHCRSTMAGILGLMLMTSSRPKLLFDMRGFWADERVDGGVWPQSKFIYRIIYRFIRKQEETLLKTADHIISLTHAGKIIIEEQMASRERHAPVTVIPCCADFNLFNPTDFNNDVALNRRSLLKIDARSFVTAYLGSIGTWYMLSEMLQFFKMLNSELPGSCFLFITKEDPAIILSAADKIGLDRSLIRIESAERSEIPELLAICNATIFFILPSYSKKASSPVKLGESLAMGVPVICNSGVGDGDYIMKDNKAGWIVNTLDENGFLTVINQIKKNIVFDKDQVRKFGEQYFSLEKGIENYVSVYRQLMK